MTEQAQRAVVTDEDHRDVEACYAAPDCVVPASDGTCERRFGRGWVLVVRSDGTVDQAFRRR
jgi:hypothetical protein